MTFITDLRRRRRARAFRRFSLPNFRMRSQRLRRRRAIERELTPVCIARYTHPKVSHNHDLDLDPNGGHHDHTLT